MTAAPLYSQQELDAKLLAAANALRGPVDPADFKAYIFPLLFLKRISDTWKWEHALALERFAGDEALAALPENYRFNVPPGCLWDDVLALPENVGAGLQLIFDRIQEANPEALAGVFGTVQWANKEVLPEERLVAVLDVFTTLKLDPDSVPHDLLGAGYEYLLKNFADESGKKAGEFFTPRAVVRLMVQLLDPKEGESIYDPACGSGGMLVESVNQVRAHGQDPRTLRLFGQEVQATTAAIARMNLYLHDIETFAVKRGDTLRDPRFRDGKGNLERFDIVIANPPFSLKNWGRSQWVDDPFGRSTYGVPPDAYGDLAFVEHMVASLQPEGSRLAVVMPHGVLFRRGAEAAIREQLVKRAGLTTVIGLPPSLFYNTVIPAVVLLFSSPAEADNVSQVRFVDASERFVRGQAQNELAEADVEAILDVVLGRAPSDIPACAVDHDALEENAWDLSVARYLTPASDAVPDVETAWHAYLAARKDAAEADGKLDQLLRGVLDG